MRREFTERDVLRAPEVPIPRDCEPFRVGARRVAPLPRWLMAGIGLGLGTSASAPAWQWGDLAEIRGRAMTGRTQMRHYLTGRREDTANRGNGCRAGRHDGPATDWAPSRLALSLTGGDLALSLA
jgi:hypothetical protein